MNKKDFFEFLKKFDLKKESIYKLIENKDVFENKNNIFLSKKKLEKNCVYTDKIIFVKLKKLLVSNFLLNYIGENTKNIINIKNSKQALNFTYGKNLVLESVKIDNKIKKNSYYIIKFEDTILGYVKLQEKRLENLMNIGEYLREN
jgi:hypothetical protein